MQQGRTYFEVLLHPLRSLPPTLEGCWRSQGSPSGRPLALKPQQQQQQQQQQLQQHYQGLYHPQSQRLHHNQNVALLGRSDNAQVIQNRQHLMQVQNAWPECQHLGSLHHPSIANQHQQFQEDKGNHEADGEESNDDDDDSDEGTENEEEGKGDDDVDDDEEDEEQQQHHHHLQPEFINPHLIFMDHHQGHFNHTMPHFFGLFLARPLILAAMSDFRSGV